MVWCDPLHDGPVPGDVSDDELIRVRARFLASKDEEVDEIAADLRDWRTAIDQQQYNELVLWYEHDLFDQLNLIQILAHLGQSGIARPVTLVSTDSFPGYPNFKGIGELEPSHVAQLYESRRPVTDAQLALGTRAWKAYRSDDPRAIEALLATDTTVLPYLAAALRRHLQEFPSTQNGLSKIEQRLMAQASDAPVEPRRAWLRMSDGERAFYVTDTTFSDRVRDLSATSPALITVRDDAYELTTTGRDVLSGAADRLRRCGIDRWLGGVHLYGRGPAWRWKGDGESGILSYE